MSKRTTLSSFCKIKELEVSKKLGCGKWRKDIFILQYFGILVLMICEALQIWLVKFGICTFNSQLSSFHC